MPEAPDRHSHAVSETVAPGFKDVFWLGIVGGAGGAPAEPHQQKHHEAP